MKIKKIIPLIINLVLIAGVGVTVGVLVSSKTSKELYTVTFDTQGGTPIESIEVYDGEKISIDLATEKNGYDLKRWTYKNKSWDFNKNTVQSDMTLMANWDTIKYTISYDLNGGYFDGFYPTSYTIEDEITLSNPLKTLGIFSGWFSQNDTYVDEISKGTTGNIHLSARWIDNLVTISNDESRGSIEVRAATKTGNTITVINKPVDNKYHLFNGWYDKNGNLLSKDQEYTFDIDPLSINYIYADYFKNVQESEWNNEHAISPIQLDSTTVLYGIYPQTHVTNALLIEKLNTQRQTKFNNYVCVDHEYYARKKAVLARDYYDELLKVRQFDDGDEIVEGDIYWFKVEPVSWKVIDSTSENLFVITHQSLDAHHFSNTASENLINNEIIYPNNYEYSEIRNWLTGEFYNNVFQFGAHEIIKTHVDNSKETTMDPDHVPHCNDTNDKVFLLSYKDYKNPLYGFDPDDGSSLSRQVFTTDYARANGASYLDEGPTTSLFSSYLLTRSSFVSKENPESKLFVSKVNRVGYLNGANVSLRQYGFQAAMHIAID